MRSVRSSPISALPALWKPPAGEGRSAEVNRGGVNFSGDHFGYDGSEHRVHGIRAMARTLLDEELGFAPHLIEHQLGHRVKDALGAVQ